MSDVCLLGPQRLTPTLADAMRDAEVTGPVAAITAGWEERESEVDELAEHLGCEVVRLELFRRAEAVLEGDAELLAGYRRRVDCARRLRGLYRLRLGHALSAARELMASGEEPSLLGPELEAAIEAVRALDAEHLKRIEALRADFYEEYRMGERDSVRRHRDQLMQLLDGCGTVAIAGGDVGFLLHRMRLFGLRDALVERRVFAWSAGAMALTERVVLFHDSPPQGPGDAELFEAGLGLVPGVVALPHARRRLRLDDAERVMLFSRRFSPSRCLTLDDGARVAFAGGRPTAVQEARTLDDRGEVVDLHLEVV